MLSNEIKENGSLQTIIIICFLLLSVWWFISYFIFKDYNNLIWGACYQIIAIIGGISGLVFSKHWGGFKSVLGKSIIFLSIGLLLKDFGQSVFSFYNLVLQIDIPYPSLSDLGFFGSIPFYIYGTILLSKASGGPRSLKTFGNKSLAVVIPFAMLLFSYFFFLQHYVFDLSNPINILLDFGYTIGQAIYVSFDVLTYILSKKFLGGVMKNTVLLVLCGLVIQYIADYNFLFEAYHQTWINGGYGDYLYLVAYFIMAISLVRIGSTFNKIQQS
ncbi:MAG: hypothetical protein ACR2IQ_02160 [Minisyncoccia bacterium]